MTALGDTNIGSVQTVPDGMKRFLEDVSLSS